MKKLFLTIIMFIILIFPSEALTQDMRGVWVSSVYNLDFPSAPGLTSAQLSAEIDSIIERTTYSGLTDIFLQVRPTCDSLYKSDIFPSSSYVCASQGESYPDDFDILEYFINEGKKAGINIHAWINPYRITRGGFSSKEEALASLGSTNPAVKLSDHVIFHSDGNLYFDPSSEEVRKLIIDGALEIVNKYDVAGIHLDDYFYPSADFADNKSYQELKLENEDLHSFRVRQVDSLIYSLYDEIKSSRPDCLFGVSPFGVWANKDSDPRGSNTHSSQSYYDHYADTLKWVKEEKLDYIMPQLYWNIGNSEADYKVLLEWWENTIRDTSVKLYTGLAAYRISEGELGYTTDELASQIALNLSSDNCSGFCVFRYNNIDDSLASVLSAYASSDPLYIAVEADNFQTDAPRFHFYGMADSELAINGQPVERSVSGYFSISKPLMYGGNSFTFTSGNNIRKINIYRNYVPRAEISEYAFTKSYDGNAVTAIFSACKVNGSFYGCFYPENISKKYWDDKTFSITVSKDDSNVYKSPSTSEGAAAILKKGTKWNVTASSGEFYHLEDLGWIKKENCTVTSDIIKADGKIKEITMSEDDFSVSIHFEHSPSAECVMIESENGYSLHFSGISDITDMPEIMNNGSTTLNSSGLVYTFTPSMNNDISGYKVISEKEYSDVVFYKKQISSDSTLPLSGISFLIDAGHGGSQSGAISCDSAIVEKDINLEYALLLGEKLSSMGASVSYTRTEDIDISLAERYSLAASSDSVFISLHSDSVDIASTDTELSGISLHVNNRHSSRLAQFISDSLTDIPVNYISRNSNLYMAKPKNTYAILVENQFVCSPSSFELLLSEDYKAQFTDSLCQILCNFFAQ